MEGLVASYSGTTLTINVDLAVGAGPFSIWNFGVAGNVGATGAPGSASITVGDISATANSKGATITNGTLNLTAANGTNGGVVTSLDQTFGGSKSFSSNVRVGTTTAIASAALEVKSTTQGFLPPRMTGAQRDLISSPATGLVIYNTSTSTLDFRSGSAWTSTSDGGVTTIGLINPTATANGASISGNILYLHAANATNGGVVTSSNQTFGGPKSFSSDISVYGMTIGRGKSSNFQNSALGYEALKANLDGYDNVAVGTFALMSTTSGYGNTAVGSESLKSNTEGLGNTALGSLALKASTGSRNTGIGRDALKNNIAGTNNTALGFEADVNASDLTNATAIGNSAKATQSNMVRLGNSTVSLIQGQVGFTAASDSRLKKNINNSKYGLSTVLQLRPVEYNLISNDLKQVGFIAQEVQKLVPEVVTGKEGNLEKGEILGITYSHLVPVLTKAIQEQQKQIEEQNDKIATQQKQIDDLKALFNKLVNQNTPQK